MSEQVSRALEQTGLCIEGLGLYGAEKVWDAQALPSVEVDLMGMPGDRHYGATRTMRRYESPDLAGVTVANDKQLSVVDAIDMRIIAMGMRLPIEEIEQRTGTGIEHFLAQQLAANIMVGSTDGGRSLNGVARSGDVLVFGSSPGTAPSMKLTEYNAPCNQPVTKLVDSLNVLGLDLPAPVTDIRTAFKRFAEARRGWVGSVYSTGTLAVGQTVSRYSPLRIPSF